MTTVAGDGQGTLGTAEFANVFELIFHNTHTFVALLDRSGLVLEINRPALEFIGSARAELLGQFLWHLPVWPLGFRRNVEAAVNCALQGQLIRFETDIWGSQGRRSTIDFSVRPVLALQGDAAYVIAEGRDITAERERQARYQAVLEALSEGVVQQEKNGAISACNGAAERILGLPCDQMLGLGSADPSWRAVHEDGSPYPGDTHPAMVALRTGQVQQDKIMGVYQPSGALVWIRINAKPLLRPGESTPYAVVSSFADITALKQAEADLRYLVQHDGLTGLPSRALLTDRLERAVVRVWGQPEFCLALLFIDLDGFKKVNDTFGHAVGDDVLLQVAHQLKLCVREGDTVARLGGDEFVVLLEGLTGPADAATSAERIVAQLTLCVPASGPGLTITASVGVALPKAGTSARELLRYADRAMYRAKQMGKSRYVLSDS